MSDLFVHQMWSSFIKLIGKTNVFISVQARCHKHATEKLSWQAHKEQHKKNCEIESSEEQEASIFLSDKCKDCIAKKV